MKPNLIGIALWSADTELGPAAGFHLKFEGPSGSGVQALARVPRVTRPVSLTSSLTMVAARLLISQRFSIHAAGKLSGDARIKNEYSA